MRDGGTALRGVPRQEDVRTPGRESTEGHLFRVIVVRRAQEESMATVGRTIRQGVIVGLIAFASVAMFYAAFDVLAARGTLYTVNLLGMAVFKGLRDPSVLRCRSPRFHGDRLVQWASPRALAGHRADRHRARDARGKDPAQSSLVPAVIVGGFLGHDRGRRRDLRAHSARAAVVVDRRRQRSGQHLRRRLPAARPTGHLAAAEPVPDVTSPR